MEEYPEDEPEPELELEVEDDLAAHHSATRSTGDEDTADALYDFDADGEDELSVNEGEHLVVVEKDGDEWWKCRNSHGVVGVVPASYLEVGRLPFIFLVNPFYCFLSDNIYQVTHGRCRGC